MLMLRITQCPDPLMWYASLVGELVPYCGKWEESYKSLEPSGYINRVEFADAELVQLTNDGTGTFPSNGESSSAEGATSTVALEGKEAQ